MAVSLREVFSVAIIRDLKGESLSHFSMNPLHLIATLSLILFFTGCIEPNNPPAQEIHLHADFAMYVDGVKWNFAQEKYMTEDKNERSKAVHLHDMDGDIIHVHAANVTFGLFLESLGMKLETRKNPEGIGHEVCFTDDAGNETCYPRFGCYDVEPGQAICVDPFITAQSWHLFVNGQPLAEDTKIEDYFFKDLDQLLLTNIAFNEDVQAQLDMVTDNACIQSEKCPERGSPAPEDDCAGSGECGVGTIPTA
jgi:hypothetical protein